MYEALENRPFTSYEADIHYHIGISFANLELYHKAIEPLSKAIERSQKEGCYYHERAKCYILTGKN